MPISGAANSSASEPAARFSGAAAYVCLGFLAGTYLSSAGMCSALPLVGGAVAASVLAAGGRRWVALLLLACAVAISAGAWRYEITAYHDSPAQVAHYAGRAVTVVGVVDGEPQASGQGVNVTVQVESLAVGSRTIQAGGRILVHYTGSQAIDYGDQLSLAGHLQVPVNPPGFDYQAYLARQGIHAVLDFPSLQILGHDAGNALQALALGLRDALRRAIDGILPRDEAALLIGILLGAPTRTLGALTAPFVASGVIHVVAISGLKVALVAGVLTALCAKLPVRVRWAPALAGVLFYTAITGATPSGLRSALMWMMALAAMQLGRRSYVWISLAVAGAGLVCWNPCLLWDTGFQLSVTGTAGIVAFSATFERVLHRVPPPLRESIAVTLAAQVATMPITAAGFGQISLVGPLANGILLPLLGPIMVLGGVAALVALLSSGLGHLLAFLVYPLLATFIGIARVLAAIPLASLAAPSAPALLVAGYYTVLVALALRCQAASIPLPHASPRVTTLWHALPRALLAGLAIAGVTGTVAMARSPDRAGIVVAGTSGSTVVLVFGPAGQSVIMDGGRDAPSLQSLLGSHLPFWQRDVSAVFLSEPDMYHAAGLFGLTSLYAVAQEVDPGAIYPSANYAQWRAELRNAAVPRIAARTGLRVSFGNGILIDVLEPQTLSLDIVPAPVAYKVRAGGLTLLMINREAALADPAPLLADGTCVDALVLPTQVDATQASSLIQLLRPHTVILSPPRKPGDTVTAAQLQGMPGGTHVWTAAPGADLSLGDQDGHCSTRS